MVSIFEFSGDVKGSIPGKKTATKAINNSNNKIKLKEKIDYFINGLEKDLNTILIPISINPIEAVKLTEYYYDLDVSFESNKEDNKIDIFSYLKSSCSENHFFLKGAAASGKSSYLQRTFLTLIKNFKNNRENYKLPIFITLSNFNPEEESIECYILRKICKNKNEVDLLIEAFTQRLVNGDFIIIFDGLDETHNNEKAINEFINFSEKYHNNKIILSSREGVLINRFGNFKYFKITPLFIGNYKNEKGSVKDFIDFYAKKGFIDDSNVERIKDGLDRRNIEKLFQSELSNPLMVFNYIKTFSNGSNSSQSIFKFYENYLDILTNKHDVNKNNFIRKSESGLSNENLLEFLEKIAFHMFKEDYNFLRYQDLEEKIWQYLKLIGKSDRKLIKKAAKDFVCYLSLMTTDSEGEIYRFNIETLQLYLISLLVIKNNDTHNFIKNYFAFRENYNIQNLGVMLYYADKENYLSVYIDELLSGLSLNNIDTNNLIDIYGAKFTFRLTSENYPESISWKESSVNLHVIVFFYEQFRSVYFLLREIAKEKVKSFDQQSSTIDISPIDLEKYGASISIPHGSERLTVDNFLRKIKNKMIKKFNEESKINNIFKKKKNLTKKLENSLYGE